MRYMYHCPMSKQNTTKTERGNMNSPHGSGVPQAYSSAEFLTVQVQ